jgi:hypothetical protein
MLRFSEIVVAGVAPAMLLAPVAARADSTTATLVYNFTYSANQAVASRDQSTMDNIDLVQPTNSVHVTSGISNYRGTLDDKGTMTVELLGKQPDGGLIVSVSEQGQEIRRAPPADCVVYGNTQVMCDPNKTVYTEEYTLLRFFGQNFVPTSLDAKRHWQITQNSPTRDVTADYVIGPTTTSNVQISEARKIRQTGGGSLTTDVESKIGYDTSRSIPTSVAEYVWQRHDNGVAGTSTTIYQTTLQLSSVTTGKI